MGNIQVAYLEILEQMNTHGITDAMGDPILPQNKLRLKNRRIVRQNV